MFVSVILAVTMLFGCFQVTALAQEPAAVPEEQTLVSAADQAVPEVASSEQQSASVTFVCTPADLSLKIYSVNGQEKVLLFAEYQESYTLEPGMYCYTAEHAGYETVAEEPFITVNDFRKVSLLWMIRMS